MNRVGIYSEIKPEPSGNPSGSALGISLWLILYFTVHPSSRHNTDTVHQGVQDTLLQGHGEQDKNQLEAFPAKGLMYPNGSTDN